MVSAPPAPHRARLLPGPFPTEISHRAHDAAPPLRPENRDAEIFADALDPPVADRAAFLDRPPPRAPPPLPPLSEEKPGGIIGHYTLVRKIGEGGGGVGTQAGPDAGGGSFNAGKNQTHLPGLQTGDGWVNLTPVPEPNAIFRLRSSTFPSASSNPFTPETPAESARPTTVAPSSPALCDLPLTSRPTAPPATPAVRTWRAVARRKTARRPRVRRPGNLMQIRAPSFSWQRRF